MSKTWTSNQIILPISGSIRLSFVHGLRGPGTFEAGLIYQDKCVDVCACEWQEMFIIHDAVKNGVFAHFPDFHERMMLEH